VPQALQRVRQVNRVGCAVIRSSSNRTDPVRLSPGRRKRSRAVSCASAPLPLPPATFPGLR
jgi:hypothetical protein